MRIQGAGDWDAIRARWRRVESEIHAPNDLVDRSFAEFDLERRKSRRRVTFAGLSVAASLFLLAGAWTFTFVDRSAFQGVEVDLPAANVPDPARLGDGPCDESASCIDLVHALAAIDADMLLQREAPQLIDGVYEISGSAPD